MSAPTRVLPDAEMLTLAVLADAGIVAGMSTETPPDLYSKLPFVVAYRFAGLSENPRLVDRPRVAVQCWAATKAEAADLSESCRLALHDAWRLQRKYAGLGSIARFEETSGSMEIPRTTDQPDGTVRYGAMYLLTIRP